MPHKFDRDIQLQANKISHRNVESYHMPMHAHEALQVIIPLENAQFEITWCLENKDTESKPLSAADVCLIPPRLEHEIRWTNCANFISILITPNYIREHIDSTFDSQNHIFQARIGMNDRFIYYLGQSLRQHIVAEVHTNYKYYDGILIVLTQHLADNYLETSKERVLFNDYAQLPCEKIREAVLYMANNLSRSLTVEEVADSVGMSHYHFTRVFKEVIGMPPAKFHMKQRIEKAKELLKKGQPIVEVALTLGFSSQSHFSNVFTKSVGLTPRKFVSDGSSF